MSVHSRSIYACILVDLTIVLSMYQMNWYLLSKDDNDKCTLSNPRYYPYIKDEVEIHGTSMFWQLQENYLWDKIDTIKGGAIHVVATVVLDLPTFDRDSLIDCWGMISYEISETQFQTPVPIVQLTVAETIDNACIKLLNESEHNITLSLKSTSSIERLVIIHLTKPADREGFPPEKKQFFHFLAEKAFEKIYDNVFLVRAQNSLMYCLVEVLSIVNDKASIRIFARDVAVIYAELIYISQQSGCRSVNQLNILLHLLRDEFPKMTVKEDVDNCVDAAMALIRELEMIRDKRSALEIQVAKAITDLLIT